MKQGNGWVILAAIFGFLFLLVRPPIVSTSVVPGGGADSTSLTSQAERTDGAEPRLRFGSVSYTEFLGMVRDGTLRDVFVTPTAIRALTSDGRLVTAQIAAGQPVVDRLAELGANVRIAPPEQPNPLTSLLFSLLPMVLLLGGWFYLMRRMQGGPGGAGGAVGFGRSRARQMSQENVKVTFADVAGADEARAELEEVVEFLRDQGRFSALGARIPRGVLLVGPPGTGKTLLAKAVAGEANVPFFSISGSDFVEMFVGVGASRVRDMFEQARKHAPCIVFIDEIDAMGRHRGAGIGGGNDEREQTLNQMLVEMDGFEGSRGVIIMAATNRPDILDPALLRPGRFDRQVTVPNPDVQGRRRILDVHAKKIRLSAGVDLETVAKGTPGFSGADLANLVNEAALTAARRRRYSVGAEDFDVAKDRILMGLERRSLRVTEKERRLTAFHEAGHALIGSLLPGCDPVHKATIVPRGRALGLVISLPEGDQTTATRAKLLDQMAMAMGGRAAEMEVFGEDEVTNGAASDIQQVTSMVRRMVMEWGFSDLLGPIRYTENQGEVFLGHSVTRQQNMSDETAKTIDGEVRRIILEAQARARALVSEHRASLAAIAEALLERETLSGDEVRLLARGSELPPLDVPVGGRSPPWRSPAFRPVVPSGGRVPLGKGGAAEGYGAEGGGPVPAG